MTIIQSPSQRFKSTLFKSFLAALIIASITAIAVSLHDSITSLLSLKYAVVFAGIFILATIAFLLVSRKSLTLDINEEAIVLSYEDKAIKLNWNDSIRISMPTVLRPRWTIRGPGGSVSLSLFDFTIQQIRDISRSITRYRATH
ncbi:MAG: hypothetical protein OEZ68_12635 [Gammaproteobacteria bacterium]|nr:hypothetical protein [Gammaproteobacteria bacterium]MDH5801643.1 hypothetical protein [Gammaproteobacteria bacterium]